jgi:uncharacterized protein YndB with AHSA1/START domain
LLDFSVNQENRTITVKREFAADLPIVWDAFTKAERLDKWWAPKPWKARTKKLDFREGGQWSYAMLGPAGEEHWAIVNYTNIQPRKKFSGVDAFADKDGNINKELPQATWEVSFTDQGDTTLVTTRINYDDQAQLEKYLEMGFKEGYTKSMEGLDELLASRNK